MNMMKTLCVMLGSVAGLLALSSDLLAACPNIGGSYMLDRSNLVVSGKQKGCTIKAAFRYEALDISLQGKWNGSSFDATVVRKNLKSGCTAKVYARLYQVNDSQLRSEVYGSDGKCELPPNYTETSIWNKQPKKLSAKNGRK